MASSAVRHSSLPRIPYTMVSNARVLSVMAHTLEAWQGGSSVIWMRQIGNENASFRTFEIAANHIETVTSSSSGSSSLTPFSLADWVRGRRKEATSCCRQLATLYYFAFFIVSFA